MSVQLNAGTGGATLAADVIASEQHQFIKVEFGTTGNATPVSTSNPMPVALTGTQALPTDAATQTTLAALNTKVPAQGQAVMAASVPVAIASDQGNIGTTDGGTSHTIDFTGQQTADLDTGAGTVTGLVVGIALPASGGPVVGGTSTNPFRTDPTGTTTQPVSAASLPLPSGAATAAKQPALGTAGTASSDVITVQGVASMTPILVNGSGVTQPVSGTVTITPSGTQTVAGAKTNNNAAPGATNIGALPAVANAAAPTQTEGNQVALRATLSGDLAVTLDGESVTISDGGGSVTTDSAQLPGTLGQKTMANALAVSLASDQSSIPVAATLTAETTKVIGTVNVAASQTIAVTNAGTFAVQATIASGATNIAKAEDVASADADVGVPAMAVRRATPVNSSGTDGDYEMLQMSAGRLWVDASGVSLTVASHAVTNAGTFAVQDSQKVADNGAFTDGTTPVNPAGFIFDETAGTALTENDIGASRMDSKRAQVLVVEDATTRGQRQAVNAGGAAEIHGDAAHDAAVAGNPVRVAGRARTSDYTSVANDDTADFITDLNGKQVVLPYAIPENFVSGAITTAMTSTTSTSLVAAPAAGLRNYLTTIIVSNAHATVGTDVVIQDGNGGTTLLTIPAAAVYGGAVITLPTPLRQPTTATAIYCANVATGASTKVSAVGYKAP